MKLYTEDQVRQSMWKLVHPFSEGKEIDEIFNSLTPIQLPNDEEIEQDAHLEYPVNPQPMGRTLAGGEYYGDINFSERQAYILSLKNFINKIQGGNK